MKLEIVQFKFNKMFGLRLNINEHFYYIDKDLGKSQSKPLVHENCMFETKAEVKLLMEKMVLEVDVLETFDSDK